MPRYILIDRYSGYIFADTADLPGWSDTEQKPADAARQDRDAIDCVEQNCKYVTSLQRVELE